MLVPVKIKYPMGEYNGEWLDRLPVIEILPSFVVDYIGDHIVEMKINDEACPMHYLARTLEYCVGFMGKPDGVLKVEIALKEKIRETD